jgi:hypothetical protein
MGRLAVQVFIGQKHMSLREFLQAEERSIGRPRKVSFECLLH